MPDRSIASLAKLKASKELAIDKPIELINCPRKFILKIVGMILQIAVGKDF